ncbi:STAS domain-containing protein [Mycobacterium simiae]|uniref:STAS domain-containing protein n=1 Tax=Mycobacterium simiae TaxID=1784 RepID=A0A5B1BTN3_MYCSI|nr:STAS domain-containing protein [Mycobacterium simiae]KAA1251105.1 STAS domain-containing protein [Mycobacterium simiae]
MTDPSGASLLWPTVSMGGGDVAIDCGDVGFRVRVGRHATVLMINGDIDAFNADCVLEHIRCFVPAGRPLIVDFSRVDFFAVHGLKNLLEFGQECDRYGANWALVASPAVSRLLRAAKVENRLPAAFSVIAALERLTHPPSAWRGH